MTNDRIMELAKQAGFRVGNIELTNGSKLPFVSPVSATDVRNELQRFAELVRNDAIDKRVKVKIGNQYGNDLNGHWFYLQPADEEALNALDRRSLKS